MTSPTIRVSTVLFLNLSSRSRASCSIPISGFKAARSSKLFGVDLYNPRITISSMISPCVHTDKRCTCPLYRVATPKSKNYFFAINCLCSSVSSSPHFFHFLPDPQGQGSFLPIFSSLPAIAFGPPTCGSTCTN